uniref:Uncharacterized protein n=1 Tax=Plectus sambesii TaxID=2011161 RepID=A0A914VYD0_9BILA
MPGATLLAPSQPSQTTRRPIGDERQLTATSLTLVVPRNCSNPSVGERRPGEARVAAGFNDVPQMPPATPRAPAALRPASHRMAQSVDSAFIKCSTAGDTISSQRFVTDYNSPSLSTKTGVVSHPWHR